MNHMIKMKKTAKTLDTVCNVAKVILTVGLVCCGVALAILLAAWIFDLAPESIGTGYETLEIGFLSIDMAQGYVPDKQMTLIFVAVEIALAGLGILVGCFALNAVKNILAPMKEGAPFSDAVAENLKKLSVYAVVLGVLSNVGNLGQVLFFQYGYGVEEMLLSDKVRGVTVNYEMDLGFLLIAAVLLLFSYVFRYGQELQKQSDETL